MATIISNLALAITMLYVCIGFPLQGARVVRRQSADDLSAPMHVMGLCTFAIWVLYAVLPASGSGPLWEIALPNSVGFLGEVWVLGLCWRYRARGGADRSVTVAQDADATADGQLKARPVTKSDD